MKKLLITGFEPFGGNPINASWEAVSCLADEIGEYQITKMLIPVVFSKASDLVIAKAEEMQADVVICVGEAGGRAKVTFERQGLNFKNARIPDNEGNQPLNEKIQKDGADAIPATLEVDRMVASISEYNPNLATSDSAGAYVCNDTLYNILYHFAHTKVKCGFIHVPLVPNEADPKYPVLTSQVSAEVITEIIKNI